MKREYDFSKAKRGPVVRTPKGRTGITIQLDNDLLDWLRNRVNKAGGGNYQNLINAVLREHVRQLENTDCSRPKAHPFPTGERF